MTGAVQSPFGRALDALIPGGGNWPPASACIARRDALDLPAEDRAWLDRQLTQDPSDWHDTWTRAEAAEPERFARLLDAICDAYYRAPGVTRRLAALADAGPRDPDDRFDPSLLTERKEPR